MERSNKVPNSDRIFKNIEQAIDISKTLRTHLDNIKLENRVYYTAPEQTGKVALHSDHRSDLYSLGVILFHLFTGRFPFESNEDIQIIYDHVATKPPLLNMIDHSLPIMISNLVEKLLMKNPDDRYQSLEGVIYDLELILNNPSNTFQFATHDISKRLLIPNILFGREKQFKQLDQAVNVKFKEIIIIGGRPGIGKSSLISEFSSRLDNKKFLMLSSKFEQQRSTQTFNTISVLLSQCVEHILLKDDQTIENFKTSLYEQVGANISLLTDFVPLLNNIISAPSGNITKLQPNEAQNRFQRTLITFIKILSTINPKLILFFDDVQWSDTATIKVIEAIMDEDSIENISIILSYRDNEIKPTHPFSLMLNSYKSKANFLELTLSPLSIENITELLVTTLNHSKEKVTPLAEVLYTKTGGNPFFVKELLYDLHRKELVFLNREALLWEWNLEKIRTINISDNVVHLVQDKINETSDELKNILILASLIGSEFNTNLLSELVQKDKEEIETLLLTNLGYNFISVSSDSKHFYFTHDKIQEAFSSFFSLEEQEEVHYKIGKLFLKNFKKENTHFLAADHLNRAHRFLNTQERNTLITLNISCAKKSITSNSYSNAIIYLMYAKSLLPQDAWNSMYKNTFSIYLLLCEAYYLSLMFEEAKKEFENALQHINDIEDRIKFIQIEIFALIAQNEMKQALQKGLNILDQLNIILPEEDDLTTYYPNLFTLYEVDSIKNLENLPTMNSSLKLSTIDILNSIMAPAYLIAPHLYAKICYVAVKECITYGNSAASTNVYAVHALLLSAFFNEFKQSFEFAKLAQQLVISYDAHAYTAKVDMIANACVKHWNTSLRETLDPLKDTVMKGVEVGDFEYACYSGMYYSLYTLMSGENISRLKEIFSEQMELMSSLKQSYQYLYCAVWRQMLYNLTNQSEKPFLLEGKYFKESEYLDSLLKTNSFSLLFNIYLSKAMLALSYGYYKKAYIFSSEARKYHIGVASLYHFSEFYLVNAVSAYMSDSDDALDMIQEALSYYEMTVKSSPNNHLHKVHLLQGMKQVLNQDPQAFKILLQASQTAKENRFLYHHLWVEMVLRKYWDNEMVFEYFKLCEDEIIETLNKWGAKGILVQQYNSNKKSLARKSQFKFEGYDLESILKASHILTQELSLEQLTVKMMDVLIENSGSQKGLFYLNQDHELILVAGFDDGKFNLNFTVNEVPNSIVNYVRRTGRHVIYSANTKEIHILDNDQYILDNKPKSLFCTPIFFQGEFRGVLYMENRDIYNLYTTERIELFQFLANQAVISIENSRLFDNITRLNQTLEEEVQQRTREYKEQKEQFERLFYDSSDAALLIESGTFIDCNTAALSMLKFKDKQELCRIKPSDISPLYQSSGELSSELEKQMIQICFEKGSNRFDWQHITKNNELFWVDVSLTLMHKDGKEIIHVLWKDITRQKELENEIFIAKENAEIALDELKQTQNQLIQNEKMAALGQLIAGVAHEVNTPIGAIKSSGNNIANFLDKTLTQLPLIYKILNTEEEKLFFNMLDKRAIHEVFRTSSEERVIKKLLIKELNEEGIDNARQFASDLLYLNAHKEWRSLLPLIKHEKHEFIFQLAYYIAAIASNTQNINHAVERVSKIIFALKTFAHFDQTGKKSPSNIKEGIDTILTIYHNQIKKGVQVVRNYSEIEPLYCFADELNQIWTNLIHNALQAMNYVGTLTISISKVNNEAVVEIQDTGSGIDNAIATKIFDPFFTTKPSGEGSGLGLDIVKKIIDKHNGTISFKSKVGEGTIFSVHLPYSNEEVI